LALVKTIEVSDGPHFSKLLFCICKNWICEIVCWHPNARFAC